MAALTLALTAACKQSTPATEAEPAALRLVTLAPHLAELVYSAGAGEFLVGVSAYSDFPESVASLPVVSDGFRIDAEALLAVQPDLVLVWGGGGQLSSIELLEKLDVAYRVIETRRLADVAPAMRELGQLAGTEMRAERSAQAFTKALQSVSSQGAPIDVFYQIGSEPMYSVSADHFISDLLSLCGARNIFATITTPVATVSVEAVVLADPDVILGAGDPARRRTVWGQFESLKAVRSGNVVGVPADLVARPSARLAAGAQAVCSELDDARQRLSASL